ncbi:MAG TPA: TetR/AcrR family transcriptional regulator [Bryobacteraceae bacterium]
MSPATSESGKVTTHQRILRVGKSLFANRGYEHTSTSAIARQAGTSESQLMKHFGNKAGLLEAVFVEGWTRITDEARAAIQDVTSPLRKLQTISGCILGSLERDPELKLLMLLEGRRIRKEGQMVALTQGFLGFVQLIDGVLYEMRDSNILRPELNPQAVRSALMGMLEGMLRDRFLADRLGFPADFNLQQLQEMLACVLGSFILKSAEVR